MPTRRGGNAPLLALPVFAVLALWFLVGPDGLDIPRSEIPAVAPSAIPQGPRRAMLGDPPRVELGGFERDCLDCHLLFRSSKDGPRRLYQHEDVVLDHGMNDTCLNCHDRENRNRLRGAWTPSVPFTRSEALCARCHGTTFRDWKAGVHGRTDGYWEASLGRPRRLSCVECHDPHRPRYGSLAPLPGPHTLRMGEPARREHEAEEPLMHWKGKAGSEGSE